MIITNIVLIIIFIKFSIKSLFMNYHNKHTLLLINGNNVLFHSTLFILDFVNNVLFHSTLFILDFVNNVLFHSTLFIL
jgi:hypothetical protein